MRAIKSFALMTAMCFTWSVSAQILDVSPAFPTVNDVVTITYNAAEGNGALIGSGTVYAHMGLITGQSTSLSNWLYVQGTWGTADASVQMTNLGNNIHQITVDMDVFYGFPAGTVVEKMAFVFRNAAGTTVGRSADGSDIYYDVYPTTAGFLAKIFSPENVMAVNLGASVPLVGKSNQNANLTFTDNNVPIANSASAAVLSQNYTVNTPGEHWIRFSADNGIEVITDSVLIVVNPQPTLIDPPAGLLNGLNYVDQNTVILKLYAPEKNNIYVLGDFNEWSPSLAYHMNLSQDLKTWWIQLDGLQPDTQYGYQYYIDGVQRFADPLSLRIADPNNDGSINAATYPSPYAYPTGLTTGFISLFETNPPSFSWQNDGYQKPEKKGLMIYELLVRDFVAKRNYQTLIDTLAYLDQLGVNAIELMPVGEFEGNESWGYNPSFHMALDKYYGTPEKFKEFVDSCHGRGIAVILDIALNHTFGQSPMVNMYWDAANSRPAANNPWFNAICPHSPYCWGYDMNHEVQATKDYIDRVNRYWLNEFHIDGYRFDFTKGFVNSGANYSNTRINIIKRMADSLWVQDPNAYVILEHWADNAEETQLANYGMMLWGNLTYEYHQAMKGYNSNLTNGVYSSRGWTNPHLVTYVESHDEERGMFECLSAGVSTNPSHNVKELPIALLRAQAAGVMMLTTPGPKMIWQFGELGYDISIDNPCRVCNKPILWSYFLQNNRRQLFDVYAATLKLRTENPVFNDGTFSHALNGSVKKITFAHPSMDAMVIANFAVTQQTPYAGFPHTGMWYEYFTGDSIDVTNVNMQIPMTPAEYRVYTSVSLPKPTILSTVGYEELEMDDFECTLYPNPASEEMSLRSKRDLTQVVVRVIDQSGRAMKTFKQNSLLANEALKIKLNDIANGTYLLLIESAEGYFSQELIKQD
jgi:1,4-alpha-glucan branching enzyme